MASFWRPFTAAEEKAVLTYIAPEEEVNLFISGDLYNFGIDQKQVHIHGYEKNGLLAGILLRYRDHNYVFYTQEEDFPFAEVADLIKKENPKLEQVSLSGKSELVKQIAPFLAPLVLEETKLARAISLREAIPTLPEAEARVLNDVSAFKEAYALEEGIEEFRDSLHGEKATVDGLLSESKRGSITIGVYVGDILVSIASTTADTPNYSMLVGVATKKEFRQRGYAKLAVSTLLKNRFEKGQRFVCLFYDNPFAGALYHKLGFEDIASYGLLHKKEAKPQMGKPAQASER